MALSIGAEDKKKLYILLGLAGVLGALVMVVINPFGIGKKARVAVAENPPEKAADAPAGGAEAPAGAPGAGATPASGAPAAGGAAPAAGGTAVPANWIAVEPFRSDPFTPYYTKAIPAPPLPPPIPPPLDLPSPDGGLAPAGVGGFGSALPSPGGGGAASASLVQLPPVRIPQYRSRNAPRLGPPQPSPGSSSEATATLSEGKRIAGVIIGDSVRALIEISDGEKTVTRVVQPGDEVEGFKVLRIQSVTENGISVYRMTILEDGQERYFDLRPAPKQATDAAALPAP